MLAVLHRRAVDGEPVLHRHVLSRRSTRWRRRSTSTRWQLQQVITAYMVPFAFASLVHGPLSDAIGRRPVMIWGMVLYTVGSVACTLAPNYEIADRGARAAGRDRRASAWSSAAPSSAICTKAPRAQRLMSLTTMIFGTRAGGGAHHRRLGARGLRLARGVRGHGGLRRRVLAAAVVEAAGDAPAAGAHSVQCAQSRGDFGHGAAPSRVPACWRWPRPSTSARSPASSARRPAIVEKHWGMSETSYAALFLPVITGIMLGATISRRIAGRMDLTRQVHMGLIITFIASALRVLLHFALDAAADPAAAGAAVLRRPSARSSHSRC